MGHPGRSRTERCKRSRARQHIPLSCSGNRGLTDHRGFRQGTAVRSIVRDMTQATEQRRGADRRRQSRGGRRPGDAEGLSPLVMVIGTDATSVGLAEAVLAKLRFAVTTSLTVEDASRVLAGLKPDIVVAASPDATRIRTEAPGGVSVVEMTDEMREDPLVLIESIRKSLRAGLVH